MEGSSSVPDIARENFILDIWQGRGAFLVTWLK
jgi:hypothetical protein